MSLLDDLHADYRRYRTDGTSSLLGAIGLNQGLWATSVYRLSHHLLARTRSPLTRRAARMGLLAVQKGVEILTQISLPAACEIGEGLMIGHFGPTVLNMGVKIGRHCNLAQGVTLGVAGRGEKIGCPTLGDRVYVGPNAILIGPIHIGDDVAIGAGTVVTKSLPPRAVAVGNPARIISYAGSFDFVLYDGMERDPGRLAALGARATAAPSASAPSD